MIHPYDLIFAGLSLDIAGAVILAKGFMFKHPKDAFYESGAGLRSNPHMLKSTLLQRAEAQVGGAFLVFGFGFQMWGNLDGGVTATELGWVNSIPRGVALLSAVVVLAFTFVTYAHLWARTQFYRIWFQDYTGAPLTDAQYGSDWPDRYTRLLDVPRHRQESDDSLAARVQARYATFGAKYRRRA